MNIREPIEARLAEIDRIYARLGVEFDYTLGESFYHQRCTKVVDELLGSEGMPVEPTTHGDGENGSLGLLLPPDEWIASFRRVADELAVSVPDVDDSRESIYGDR